MFEGKICPICGKEFFPIAEHAYKKQMHGRYRYYCSWTCLNHKTEETVRKYKYKRVLQYSREGSFIKRFDSVNQIFDCFGYNPNMIREACRGKIKTAYGFIWKYEEDVDT